MTTVAQARRWQFFRKLFKLFLAITAVSVLLFIAGPKFGSIWQALTPPTMRAPDTLEAPTPLDQGWPADISRQFHSISQGTRTLPVPLSWLKALEAPVSNPLKVLLSENSKFLDDDYILRFGFIKSDSHPLGLPLGFAVTPAQNIPGIADVEDAVGFTCAACHTSHLTHGDHHFLIDGGPAVTDLGNLTKALGAALGQTLLSSKLPLLNGRFDRFAKGVLGDVYEDKSSRDTRVLKLKAELDSLVAYLASVPGDVDVVEGFTRLDALNRIGNQSFAIDYQRFENYVPPNAPVNYPHIWTASWFDWVQYDGSIMAPLIRNAGEGLGVSAYVNLTAPHNEGRFSSSVNIENLVWIEDALSGEAPYTARKFTGLLSPPWPAELGAIDEALAAEGHALYKKKCQGCHLPAVTDDEFWTKFSKVDYQDSDNTVKQTGDELLRLKTIPLEQIGTDPAQANVLVDRRVNTAGNADSTLSDATWGMGLNSTLCTVEPQPYAKPEGVGYPSPDADYQKKGYPPLVEVDIKDGPNLSFALALGALVEQVNESWFDNNFIPPEQRKVYEKDRPNCLRAGAGYKARPLNGVWATAPYLHNGSVATVYELLSPPEERASYVQLGTTKFDVKNMGVLQDAQLAEQAKQNSTQRYIDGYFILDTTLPGNLNTGHEFSDRWIEGTHWSRQPAGVIGSALTEEQRNALIEFLKTQ